jgi:peptide deformylase
VQEDEKKAKMKELREKAIAQFLVQNEENDNDVLNRPLFDVNMRLYNTEFVLEQQFDDYDDLKGISGANLGVPWNIIAYKWSNSVVVMINPKITHKSSQMVRVKSNCGSLRLPDCIEVERHVFIDCAWYDCDGSQKHQSKIGRQQGGLTIQHEVEHNQGILITSK